MKSAGSASPPRSPGTAANNTTAADDRGSLTLMLLALFIGLVALAGIVIDGGAKLAEGQRAAAVAQEAARAGAGIVNPAQAYTSGSFAVARNQALDAATNFMTAEGFQGSAIAVGADSIQVTVKVTEPTRILSIIGIDSMTSTGSATAELVTGVTGPGA